MPGGSANISGAASGNGSTPSSRPFEQLSGATTCVVVDGDHVPFGSRQSPALAASRASAASASSSRGPHQNTYEVLPSALFRSSLYLPSDFSIVPDTVAFFTTTQGVGHASSLPTPLRSPVTVIRARLPAVSSW